MILFHQNLKAHKISAAGTEQKKYILPNRNGMLAVDSDLEDEFLISMIERPTILTPEPGTIYNNTITYTPYTNNPLYTGNKTGLHVQIALDVNFTNITQDIRVEDTDINNVTTNLPVNDSQAALFIRVKYFSNDYSSPWSETVETRSKKIIVNAPVIVTPINNSTGVSSNIVISGSNFFCTDLTESHHSTTYHVATDSNFLNLLLNTTTELNSQKTSYIFEGDINKTYYIRMRYTGKRHGNSEWSNVIKVST